MPDIVLYSVFFGLSVLCIITAVAAGAIIHKKSIKNADTTKKHSALTPFHAFLIGFFLSTVIMFFPVYYTGWFSSDASGIRVVKSLLMALLATLQIFFLNGDFTTVGDSVNAAIPGGFGTGYIIYSNVLHVIAPIMTFGFILSFFRETIAMLKYVLHPFTDIYVISELNESSFELAKDIINTDIYSDKSKKPRKKQVVFTDVFEKDDEAMFELIAQAKRLGAVCLKKDITELGLKRTRINRKLFFISDNEDENLRQALTIIKRCNGNPRYDRKETQLYVFASSTESETLLDAVNHGEMKVRRINERHNLIIDTLMNNSVFDGAIPDEKGVRHITAAIMGLGMYGIELLKALCWLCQMPGYELTLHVFEAGKGKAKIESIAPELISHNDDSADGSKIVAGDAHYRLIFHDDTDVKSNEFAETVRGIKTLTAAFVTLGTDEQNIETAMKLRMILARDKKDDAEPFPPIYSVVYSALKNEIVEPNGILGLPDDSYNNKYGIKFIGDISTRFSLNVIEQLELEERGKACHLAWSETKLQSTELAYANTSDPQKYLDNSREAEKNATAELDEVTAELYRAKRALSCKQRSDAAARAIAEATAALDAKASAQKRAKIDGAIKSAQTEKDTADAELEALPPPADRFKKPMDDAREKLVQAQSDCAEADAAHKKAEAEFKAKKPYGNPKHDDTVKALKDKLAEAKKACDKARAEYDYFFAPEYVIRCETLKEVASGKLKQAQSDIEKADELLKLTDAELKAKLDDLREKINAQTETVEDDKAKYEKYEYFRKSSVAQSVHQAYMLKYARYLFGENGEASELAGIYEHNRWNAYMRGIGYCRPDEPDSKRKNHIAKLHHDIKPYAVLTHDEKIKDVAVKSAQKKK